jgi:hypothetical protein
MRTVRDRPDGHRLRALIVLLWRAGLRISEALALQESDLDRSRGAVLVRRGKAASGARSEWTDGPGSSSTHGSRSAASSRSGAPVRDPRPDSRPALGTLGRTQSAASCGRRGGRPTAVRAPPTATRTRGRDGTRRRPAGRDPAPARTTPTSASPASTCRASTAARSSAPSTDGPHRRSPPTLASR